jgi:hypothetical protein
MKQIIITLLIIILTSTVALNMKRIKRFHQNIKNIMRKLFNNESLWRLFLVLQVIGLIALFGMELSDKYWNMYPTHRYGEWTWAIFDSYYWKLENNGYCKRENWFLLLYIFGPFVLTKATDLVISSKKKENKS